ncbi:uncharacterized protein LOC131162823 [Malania oleifera]|uniref:uncharacterized protein LOC131162823 n=1 Tax=Malania oleifera TaxID=397392 RepID=UPI0025AE0DED|nr:uncharacterized protein LOC131162823 [Malania oleifera]
MVQGHLSCGWGYYANSLNCAFAVAYSPASDDTQKSHRSRHRTHKSSGSSHKTISRTLSCDSQSKGSVSTPRGSTKVDLSKLEMAALWRYWRHFNLVEAFPDPSKEQLIDVVQGISCRSKWTSCR